MQAIDLWRRDLERSLAAGGRPLAPAAAGKAIRGLFASAFRALPGDLLDALLEGLEDRFALDPAAETARCATLGSVLLMDYDGGPLGTSDWDALREAFSDSGGEVDLELLTYVMQLVLDQGRM